jgi:signal transduction histidine kinase
MTDRTHGRPFLPIERTEAGALAAEIERAAASPVITALLEASASAAAVLDARRQVIAFNGAYLALAGFEDPAAVLGLRHGEALGCVHAKDSATGCGTTAACPSCGAALALLAVLHERGPAERRCALRAATNGAVVDREFTARVSPLEVDGARLVLLTLRDVTAEARRTMIERSFLHDLSNLASGLQSAAADLVPEGAPAPDALDDVRVLADELVQQIRVQKLLSRGEHARVDELVHRRLEVADAIALLRRTVVHHPAVAGRVVEWPQVPAGLSVRADVSVLHHVLMNMALNALEAVAPGARVRVAVAAGRDEVRLQVWNPGAIPPAVAPRIFQRYFSTKSEPGRGHGTWTMKHFGEELLGGRVSFETSEAAGTTFAIALPRSPGPDGRL